jgi:hypothetical protein
VERPNPLVAALVGAWCLQGFSHALVGFSAMMSV